jgi:hypothetical protein
LPKLILSKINIDKPDRMGIFISVARRNAQPHTEPMRIITTSTPRTEMFNGIAQAVVTATWRDGSQTIESLASLKFADGKITIR